MPPKLFLATKAFLIYEGKVLILRESGSYQDGTNAGRYDLPGGRLNPGEKYDEALAREVLEETGLTIKIKKPLSVGEWHPTVRGEEWQIVGIFFECEVVTNEIKLSEDHDAFEWINPTEFAQFPIIPNLHDVFKTYNLFAI